MRILVCTKADLPSLLALNRLLPGLRDHAVDVVLTDRTRPAERTLPELSAIKFLERDLPFQVMFPLLERTGPDAAGPRVRTFAELSTDLGVRVTTVRSINDGDGFALATAFAPDLVVSVRFSLLFRTPMLRLPRYGILNLHPGPLPGYGGLFAIFRQMLAGQSRIGLTLHKVDHGIDTGPVVSVRPMAIEPGRSMLWHVLRAYSEGIPAILDAVAALAMAGELAAQPQDLSRMHYFHLPDQPLLDQFAWAGHRLYDFDEYAADMRAFFGVALPAGAAGRLLL